MGERKVQGKTSKKLMVKAIKSDIGLIEEDTPSNISVMTKSGRIQVRWDKNAKATTMG